MQENRLDVLIIDESGIVRARLAEMLSRIEGVHCIGKVGNAKKGLELVSVHKPGLIILDIRLEDRIGLDIVGEVKQISPASVVIVLTNYPFSAYRIRCLALGADYFLDKSLEFSIVYEITENMVSRKYRGTMAKPGSAGVDQKMTKPLKHLEPNIHPGHMHRKGI